MFTFNGMSDQQIWILYGIATYATAFPILLVTACVAGYLHRLAATAASQSAATKPKTAPLPGAGVEATPVAQAA
jgi:hypothetical protein